MPSITIDDEVFAALQARGRAFVDTPNSVLRKELGLDAGSAVDKLVATTSTPSRPGLRANRGEGISQADYEVPLLRAIAHLGGEAPRAQVLQLLGESMADKFAPIDLEPLASGSIRWQKTASWAVKSMKDRGLLKDTGDSGWGTWAITTEGRIYYEVHGK
jgi:hypothetical protein